MKRNGRGGGGTRRGFASQRRLRQYFVDHHPIEQSPNPTEECVVTARSVTRTGGYECIDVSRGNLLEFRDTLTDCVFRGM